MTLQDRQKWNKPRRNIEAGDIVLLKDDTTARNHWRTARIEEARQDEDGLVRNVKVVVGDAHIDKRGQRVRNQSVLEQPIQKIILLLKADNCDKDSPSGSLV